MSQNWNRRENWVAGIIVGVVLIFVAVQGLEVFMRATATPLHKSAKDAPSASGSPAAPRWADAVARAGELARGHLVEHNLPGLSVAVGTPDGIAWAEGFGYADLERKTPVRPDTRFRIGTASIVLTSAAIGILVDRGRLKLDEAIHAIVPEFPKDHGATLRQVMGHTAGLRNDGGDEGPLFSKRCAKPVEAFDEFAEDPLRFPAGSAYRFSIYGWIVVSAVVEAASGTPFLAFMRKEVFDPLGMNDTSAESEVPEPPATPDPRVANAYFPRFGGDPKYGPDPMRPLGYSCYSGASVFVSTPSDLVRFAQGIAAGKLVRPSTVGFLQTPGKLRSGDETGYGLGWDIENVALNGKPTRWIGHDGDILAGNAASLMTFPEHGLVVAIAANTSYAQTDALGLKIAEVFAAAK